MPKIIRWHLAPLAVAVLLCLAAPAPAEQYEVVDQDTEEVLDPERYQYSYNKCKIIRAGRYFSVATKKPAWDIHVTNTITALGLPARYKCSVRGSLTRVGRVAANKTVTLNFDPAGKRVMYIHDKAEQNDHVLCISAIWKQSNQ